MINIELNKLPTAAKIFYYSHNGDKIIKIKNRILIDNRDSKIEAIVNDLDFTENKLEDDPEYIKLSKIEIRPLPPPSNIIHHCKFTYK